MNKNSEVAFIFKRSFLGFFWIIVFIPLFIAYFFFESVSGNTDMVNEYGIDINNPYIIFFVGFYAIVGVLYTFVTRHVKYIERVIRLMSEKEGVKITPSKSLRIAKNIFYKTTKFSLLVFFKYYLIVFIVFIFSFYISFNQLLKFAFNETTDYQTTLKTFAISAFIVLSAWIYMKFFIAAKVRFVWFVYMEKFGNFSNKEIFDEVSKLNSVDPKDDKDAIVGYIKRDLAADLGSVASSAALDITKPIDGGTGIAKGYARGMILDSAEYSKIKLNFAQYKKVYIKEYGKNPELSPILLNK